MVKRGPWNVVKGGDSAESANALEALAEEVRQDPDVSGVIVIVHRRSNSTKEFVMHRTGLFRRSVSLVTHACMTALSRFL